MHSTTPLYYTASMPTKPCDPCFEAPVDAQARCRSFDSGPSCAHGTGQCAWLLRVEKTLAFHWDETRVRGWGNFWAYLRTYHYAAALLGRRLLLTHRDGALPTDALWLGGERSWRLRQDASRGRIGWRREP